MMTDVWFILRSPQRSHRKTSIQFSNKILFIIHLFMILANQFINHKNNILNNIGSSAVCYICMQYLNKNSLISNNTITLSISIPPKINETWYIVLRFFSPCIVQEVKNLFRILNQSSYVKASINHVNMNQNILK